MPMTSVRATAEERGRTFPADPLLADPIASWTHGVTIAAPPRAVWPWLAQMGAGRAGWYSWDRLDNGGRRSAETILPGMDRVSPGDLMPAGPGVTGAFVVARAVPERDLVLAVPDGDRAPRVTWEFLLDPLPGERTRLLVRARVSGRGWMEPMGGPGGREDRVGPLLARLPRGPILAVARGVHRVMQARQLRGLRRRTEGAVGRRGAIARLVVADNGMNVVGQGGRIMLSMAPVLVGAILAHLYLPDLVRLPLPGQALTPLGVALAAAGAALWATAVTQLLRGFPKGRLVTSGAYAVCRNPIYASVALLVLPGVALLSGSWGYLLPAAALLLAVQRFIPAEERDLARVFGEEYRRYTARVHRVLPFVRPKGRASAASDAGR